MSTIAKSPRFEKRKLDWSRFGRPAAESSRPAESSPSELDAFEEAETLCRAAAVGLDLLADGIEKGMIKTGDDLGAFLSTVDEFGCAPVEGVLEVPVPGECLHPQQPFVDREQEAAELLRRKAVSSVLLPFRGFVGLPFALARAWMVSAWARERLELARNEIMVGEISPSEAVDTYLDVLGFPGEKIENFRLNSEAAARADRVLLDRLRWGGRRRPGGGVELPGGDSMETDRAVELIDAVDEMGDSELATLRRQLDETTRARIMEDVPDTSSGCDAITIPDNLLTMPGIVDGYIEHCQAHAPVFNRRIAFLGGLSLLSFLSGRKYQSETGLRTNLYTVALASSGAGKDFTRKLNQEILLAAGFIGAVVREIGSGQGLEDALVGNPCKLLLTDEADALLASIRGQAAKDGNPYTEKILLELYTSAASLFETRQLAGRDSTTISCPHLVMQASAVTPFFFANVSEKMSDGGLIARMLILGADEPRNKRLSAAVPPPAVIVEWAKWFKAFLPGGDLAAVNPDAKTVPCEPAARSHLESFLRLESKESEKASRDDNLLAAALWNRSTEQAIKLSVLAALSVDPVNPVVTGGQAEWATAFAVEHVKQVLTLTERYGASGNFEKAVARITRKVQRDGRVPRSTLLKHAKVSAREFDQYTRTLIERREIEAVEVNELGVRRTDYIIPV